MNSGWKVKELQINSKVKSQKEKVGRLGHQVLFIAAGSSHHSIEYGGTGKSQEEKCKSNIQEVCGVHFLPARPHGGLVLAQSPAQRDSAH